MTDTNPENSIIRLFHVYKRYASHSALIDISLDVARNELLMVTGPSGAGKSTLLKLLYLGESASEGQILIDGINLARINRSRIPFLRRKFGIIFQDYKLIPSKTIYENIALVMEVAGYKSSFIQKKVSSVLRTVAMEDRLNAYPQSLSGGEQQRIAFARAVVGDPQIILADEPTGSLDTDSANIIMSLLKEFHARGTTLIIATHDKSILRKTQGRIVYLNEGRLENKTITIDKKPAITL